MSLGALFALNITRDRPCGIIGNGKQIDKPESLQISPS